ncbi:unnamed protein product [Vitrella brassicaformis CCMP3155]|uniref:Uncharacterized protein n=1 Tax=Vitrella brassicaformis (strain CCMP3155) TaxID=1169540 RepID=A0A0G4EUG0_VITBC|nr:unnamed protein product [Vitrella brassicaformis CCMP3155]|eukprot:CEM01845.1 unnamed protein product [Vitrella brassicaformis CCMP3155]
MALQASSSTSSFSCCWDYFKFMTTPAHQNTDQEALTEAVPRHRPVLPEVPRRHRRCPRHRPHLPTEAPRRARRQRPQTHPQPQPQQAPQPAHPQPAITATAPPPIIAPVPAPVPPPQRAIVPAPPHPDRITPHQRAIRNRIVQLIETGNDAAAGSEAVRLIRNNRDVPLAGKDLFRRLAAYARLLPSEQKFRIATAILDHQPALANEIDEHPHQSGQVAIHHFSQYPLLFDGHQEALLRLLVAKGGAGIVSLRDDNDRLPLHIAAASYHDDCTTTRWLCENGAAVDINTPNGDNLTPLRLDADKNDPAWGSPLYRRLTLLEFGASVAGAGVRPLPVPHRVLWEEKILDAYRHHLEWSLIKRILAIATTALGAQQIPLPAGVLQRVLEMAVPQLPTIADPPLSTRINTALLAFLDAATREDSQRELRSGVGGFRCFRALTGLRSRPVSLCTVVNRAIRDEARRYGLTLGRIRGQSSDAANNGAGWDWRRLGVVKEGVFKPLYLS